MTITGILLVWLGLMWIKSGINNENEEWKIFIGVLSVLSGIVLFCSGIYPLLSQVK